MAWIFGWKGYNKAMARNGGLRKYLFSLGLAAAFLSGCVYLKHFDDAMFMKGLDDSQKDMQAALAREEKLYNKLKADIDNGRLKKLAQKKRIFRLYGEPALCKPPELRSAVKEVCFYRDPEGGLLTEMILLDFDSQGQLCSWEVRNPGEMK